MIAIPSGFSPEDYLALEPDNTVRHQYRRGLVYAMAGGSDDHSRLYINFITAINLLANEIRGCCRVLRNYPHWLTRSQLGTPYTRATARKSGEFLRLTKAERWGRRTNQGLRLRVRVGRFRASISHPIARWHIVGVKRLQCAF
jgi:hypothetical protein